MKTTVLAVSICLLASCEQQRQPAQPETMDGVQTRAFQPHPSRDTAAYAVLPFDADLAKEISSEARAATLSSSELNEVDSLLRRSIAEANIAQRQRFRSVVGRKAHTIDLATYRYRRQLLAVIVPSGDKIVWVNCFCGNFDDWRRRAIFVDDGGNCFFHVKINLTTGRWYGFTMNEQG